MREFQEVVKPADFTVLVFTYVEPEDQWGPLKTREYVKILQILSELQIRHFDLKPLALAAASQGIDLQETPGDVQHPSDAFAEYIASRLKDHGLLDSPVTAASRDVQSGIASHPLR